MSGHNRRGVPAADPTMLGLDADPTVLGLVADPTVPGLDARVHDALSCLHAYVLALDAERGRVATRLEVHRDGGVALARVSELEQRHSELTEELNALRTTIDKLREYADPTRRYL